MVSSRPPGIRDLNPESPSGEGEWQLMPGEMNRVNDFWPISRGIPTLGVVTNVGVGQERIRI
jgi:hypothetical protein